VSRESTKDNSGSSCGSNFIEGKSDTEQNLGILDDDHVLKEDSLTELTEITSRESKEKYVNWYESNKMALEMAINIMNNKGKNKRKFRAKNSTPGTSKSGMKTDLDKMKHKPTGGMKCFFCKKLGHFKKDCEGFKAWLKMKGSFLSKSILSHVILCMTILGVLTLVHLFILSIHYRVSIP
jgi:predicted metal-dependent peptidase